LSLCLPILTKIRTMGSERQDEVLLWCGLCGQTRKGYGVPIPGKTLRGWLWQHQIAFCPVFLGPTFGSFNLRMWEEAGWDKVRETAAAMKAN
jgi:hypothetical protein